MCTQTFHNLPEFKKKKILETAIDEFSTYGFDLANIQRIIEQAGISRGSFYQYFEDISDLYVEVLLYIAEIKIKHYEKVINRIEHLNFEQTLFFLWHDTWLEFCKKHPKIEQIGMDIVHNKTFDIERLKDIFESRQSSLNKQNIGSLEFYKSIIKKAIDNKELSSEVSIDTMTFFLKGILEQSSKLLLSPAFTGSTSKKSKQLIKDYIYLICNGFNNPQGKNKKVIKFID